MSMDYEKKYREVLERAKNLYEKASGLILKKWIEQVFPELRESEEDIIKKELKHFLEVKRCGTNDDKEYRDCNKFLAWLEKHKYTEKDLDKAYECADKVQYRRGYEDAKKEIEKQGEQKLQSKSTLEVWKDMRLEVYAQASGNRHEPNCSDDKTKMFSLSDIDEIIEKISNQKSTGKDEPKFKVGDWITIKE